MTALQLNVGTWGWGSYEMYPELRLLMNGTEMIVGSIYYMKELNRVRVLANLGITKVISFDNPQTIDVIKRDKTEKVIDYDFYKKEWAKLMNEILDSFKIQQECIQ